MLALLIPLIFSTDLQEGDHWLTERTMRYVQEVEHVDAKNVDKLNFQVVRVNAETTEISCETTPGESSKTKQSRKVVSFKPSGALISKEDSSDQYIERINRMEWTATEARKGIEWSRNWPASSDLLEAKVNVKPTSRTETDITFLVTYKEGENTKCVATIKVLDKVRIIEDLALTINNVQVPGATKPGSLIVTEKLKEMHLVGR